MENKAFAAVDLREGCASGNYPEISQARALKAKENGALISSAFTIWQDIPEGRKGRFVVNLSEQSKHWKKVTIRMESLPEFAMQIQQVDHFISFDLKKGYRHFRLHPDKWDWFIFRYKGRYYQCAALPFGWGRSHMWFTQLTAPFARCLRQFQSIGLSGRSSHCTFPLQNYSGHYPLHEREKGNHVSLATFWVPAKFIQRLLGRFEQVGAYRGTYLHCHDEIPDSIPQSREGAKLLQGSPERAAFGRRWVGERKVEHFCCVCVALFLAMPWARFYTCSLYWNISVKKARDEQG